MKPHYKPLATALAAALQLAATAAVPVAWTNSPGMPPYPLKPVPHGSSVDLAVTLKGYTTPPIADGADVRLWYQTNGMGSAWWSAPATFDGSTITATFGPAQDCGADRVSLFFGAPSNVFASAVLRLTHAPGFTPASLPPPPGVAMQPWVIEQLAALAVAATNYTDQALIDTIKLSEFKPEENPRLVFWDFDATWESPRLALPTEFRVSDIVPGDYAAVSSRAMRISMPDDDGHPPYIYDPYFHGTAQYAENAGKLFIDQSPWALTVNDERWGMRYGYSAAMGYEYRPFAYLSEVQAVSNTANAAARDAASALRIVLGESVWFAVTNYMRTAEGVIPSLQLWEVRDSVTNLVYDSREEITNTVKALTRELHTELTNSIHAVSNAMPSKAWGNYQSDGTDNPEPGKVAIINPPTVILTGGGTFNKYLEVGDSSLWVLQSSGPVTFGGNTNGNYFAVLDDEGKPHFRVAKTDSYDLPAFISGILPRQSQNHILIYTATTNRHGNAVTEHPTISVCSDLKESVWHEEVDGEIDALGISVSWTRDDTIPAWVATVTPDNYPPNLYFRCKVVQEGGVSIINTAPVRFDGGVQFGNGTYRLVPYTTGGKTYLTVEGLQ